MTVSREYIGPVTFTVILHSILLLWMMGSFMTENRVFEVPEPKFVRATLVSMEQKKKKGPRQEFQQKKPEPVEPEITPPPEPKVEPIKEPEPVPQPKLPEPKPEPKVEPKPEVKPEPVVEKPKIDEAKIKAEAEKKRIEEEKRKKAEDEKKRVEDEQRKKAEAEKKRKEAEAEKKRLEDKKRREAALLDSMEDEKPQEESDPNATDEVSAESYIGMIAHTIGSNWSRPMSARNGMQVVLRIQLIPTGEVIGVSVIKSSGDLAFDRAAVAAVEKSHQFPELAELDSRTFEKNFRTFSLTFNPQDLRL